MSEPTPAELGTLTAQANGGQPMTHVEDDGRYDGRYQANLALIAPHLRDLDGYALAMAGEYLARYIESSDGAEMLHEALVTILTEGSKLNKICKVDTENGYCSEEAAEFGVLIANELTTNILPKLTDVLRSHGVFLDAHRVTAHDIKVIANMVGE